MKAKTQWEMSACVRPEIRLLRCHCWVLALLVCLFVHRRWMILTPPLTINKPNKTWAAASKTEPPPPPPTTTPAVCQGFQCADGSTCLNEASLQCDGRADCPDFSDELNCPQPPAPGRRVCFLVQCLPSAFGCVRGPCHKLSNLEDGGRVSWFALFVKPDRMWALMCINQKSRLFSLLGGARERGRQTKKDECIHVTLLDVQLCMDERQWILTIWKQRNRSVFNERDSMITRWWFILIHLILRLACFINDVNVVVLQDPNRARRASSSAKATRPASPLLSVATEETTAEMVATKLDAVSFFSFFPFFKIFLASMFWASFLFDWCAISALSPSQC